MGLASGAYSVGVASSTRRHTERVWFRRLRLRGVPAEALERIAVAAAELERVFPPDVQAATPGEADLGIDVDDLLATVFDAGRHRSNLAWAAAQARSLVETYSAVSDSRPEWVQLVMTPEQDEAAKRLWEELAEFYFW